MGAARTGHRQPLLTSVANMGRKMMSMGEIINPQSLGLCKLLQLQLSPQVSPSLEAMHNLPSPLQALTPHQLKFQTEKSNQD